MFLCGLCKFCLKINISEHAWVTASEVPFFDNSEDPTQNTFIFEFERYLVS